MRVGVPLVAPRFTVGAAMVSGWLWACGFMLYAIRYAPFLIRPRLDGKAGLIGCFARDIGARRVIEAGLCAARYPCSPAWPTPRQHRGSRSTRCCFGGVACRSSTDIRAAPRPAGHAPAVLRWNIGGTTGTDMDYFTLKLIHQSAVTLSITGFASPAAAHDRCGG